MLFLFIRYDLRYATAFRTASSESPETVSENISEKGGEPWSFLKLISCS